MNRVYELMKIWNIEYLNAEDAINITDKLDELFDHIEAQEKQLEAVHVTPLNIKLEAENKKLKEKLSNVMMILSGNCGDDGDNYRTIDKLENLLFPELKDMK